MFRSENESRERCEVYDGMNGWMLVCLSISQQGCCSFTSTTPGSIGVVIGLALVSLNLSTIDLMYAR